MEVADCQCRSDFVRTSHLLLFILSSELTAGCGIVPTDLPFIFEHFYRADEARDKKSGGSGIGLAIVKQLTEIHGGFVEVRSDVGKGSHFSAFLPVGN